jgi:hypothetical protein
MCRLLGAGWWPEPLYTATYWLLRIIGKYASPHPFDPWRCDGCNYEADCGIGDPEIIAKWETDGRPKAINDSPR